MPETYQTVIIHRQADAETTSPWLPAHTKGVSYGEKRKKESTEIYYLMPLRDYSNEYLLAKGDEISLLLMINKIQTAEDVTAFRSLPPGKVEAILRDSPGHVVDTIADILLAFLLRANVPAEEAEALTDRVKEKTMEKQTNFKIEFNMLTPAISVMREVAAWGRQMGYRVWPDEWLTPDELVTPDAQPENFCLGILGDRTACAFILQWTDSEYWPNAPKYEAAYLHKFCVCREFSGRGMTQIVISALKEECRKRAIPYIRLDTALDEKTIRKLYLKAGFQIVDIIDYPNGRSMALYELKV